MKTPNEITDFFILSEKGLLAYGDKNGNIGLAYEQKDTTVIKVVEEPCDSGMEKYNGLLPNSSFPLIKNHFYP